MGAALKYLIPAVVILAAIGLFIFITFKGNTAQEAAKPSPNPSTQALVSSPSPVEKREYVPQKGYKEISVVLEETNNSGLKGSAKITKVLNQTLVTITMQGKTDSSSYPTYIGLGSCSNIKDSKYQLARVKNGVSKTTLDIDFEQIIMQKPLALVVEKIGNKTVDPVACGVIN